MHEVKDGIYRLDGKISRPREAPLVVVHPFYKEAPIGYIPRVSGLIRGYKGNVFIFEEERRVISTLETLYSFDFIKGRHLIITENNSPELVDTNPEEVARFISLFGRKLQFAGGFVWGDIRGRDRFHNGCLGTVMEWMKEAGLTGQLVDSCCF